MSKEIKTMQFYGAECTKMVLFDEDGTKYTFAIPGSKQKPNVNFVAWIVDIELSPKEEND